MRISSYQIVCSSVEPARSPRKATYPTKRLDARLATVALWSTGLEIRLCAHVHATVLRLPTIKRTVGNTVFADYFIGWNSGFMLVEDSDDLLLRLGLALHIDFSLGSI